MKLRFRLTCFLFLFFSFFAFCDESDDSEIKLLSLQQIDTLIDATSYNEALKALTKYIETYPNDFDRAQKRISRIMNLRESFNKGAESLVDVIRNGDQSKTDKITKITELESSELEANDNVLDFTNLARRTVTLGEVLLQYNRIMREGIDLIQKEKYSEAAVKFEEGFAIKNEFSDMVFEAKDIKSEAEGKIVVYESDITEPVRRAISNIRSLVAGSVSSESFNSKLLDCEKAYTEYIRAVSSKKIPDIQNALTKVNKTFSALAELRNKIINQAKVLENAENLANERNPLLMGTSYIAFHQKFIMGDVSNPDTGILGAFDAYFNNRVESMKSKTNDAMFTVLNNTISKLPENKIYSLASRIPSELKNVDIAKDYAEFSISLQNLYNLEKNLDGSSVGDKYSVYSSSVKFVNEYISDLALSYSSASALADAKSNPGKTGKNDLTDKTLNTNIAKLFEYQKIEADSKNYLTRVDNELKNEKKYFDEKLEREHEIDELIKLSGGRLKINYTQKRTTAGVQISDAPLDFRKQISYFTSICNRNISESENHEKALWGYIAYAYGELSEKSYNQFDERCTNIEKLFDGEKKFPVEAKEWAEKLNQEISQKKESLLEWQEMLKGGEEYRLVQLDYNQGCEKLAEIILKFDSLRARNVASIEKALPQIAVYEAHLRDGYAQYEKAVKEFKKGNFDEANAALDASAGMFAMALETEYSEKIRSMREDTLGELGLQIQQAEYEKVLREVFTLKDQATSYYYSSNFDAAESVLVTAQSKWSKVSLDPDSEIEDLLNIVKTVKSVSYGRVLLQSDPHYPELSYSLDMANQSYERGVQFQKNGETEKAQQAFEIALTNVRNVQNVYPLNKEARLISLRIAEHLDPEGFPRQFENQYNAAKMNSNKNEQLAELEDLYSINPKYPHLAEDIYQIKDSLGMFPKKTVQKSVKNSSDEKFAEAKRIFNSSGNNTEKLNQALSLVNEAIALDGSNKKAKELKLDIQLKIGSKAVVVLSQADEKMYSEAARLFNQRKFAEAKSVMDNLLASSQAKNSRKVVDLYNRLLKRL